MDSLNNPILTLSIEVNTHGGLEKQGSKQFRNSLKSLNSLILHFHAFECHDGCIGEKALELGFNRAILQTKLQMEEAVHLYTKRGYVLIDNYPYDKFEERFASRKNSD